MKWKSPVKGDVRERTYFALIPVALNGETRWLEMVTVKQEFLYTLWHSLKFVDPANSKDTNG